MLIREYFADLDAYYINLASAKHRRDDMEREFSDVFSTLTRVEPVHTNEQDGAEFVQDMQYAYANCNSLHRFDYFRKAIANYIPGQASKYCSLYRTTRQNLQTFLESDKQRVVFLEDDATCRTGFLDCDMSIPDADMIVWGGACADVHKDSVSFMRHSKYRLKRLDKRRNAIFTTCYEVSRRGAEAFLEAFDNMPAMPIDLLWMYAFDVCNAYACYPMGIAQQGTSGITGAKSSMDYTRTE